MTNSRRDFIKHTGLVSLGFLGLNRFAANAAFLDPISTRGLGFGPLVHKSGDLLSLPKGFSAKVISKKGDLMNDGFFSPGNHDGMGVFKWKNDKVMLIRNHELTPGSDGSGAFGADNKLLHKANQNHIYDTGKGERLCVGGTTTMVYDEKKQQIELEYLSLTGTIRNCAGGITPWNSWITCEETELGIGDEDGFLEKDHGYNFEVFASDKIVLTPAIPIKPMGRFVHEAVAVHPTAGIVYQTEDSGTGVFYRYLPNVFGELHKGGKLQALVISEWKSADTRNYKDLKTDRFPEKKSFKTEWIDLDNVDAPENDLRLRAYQQGAARFSAAEGIWYGNNELFFACTSGGRNSKGQIFRYTPSEYEGQPMEKDHPGTLELFLEPNDINTFQNCDNLTIAPWGDVIICEDKEDARIIGITPQGKTYVIAQNIGLRESEFAGPVFSPSGKTLFVNIQSPGLTLAITGPWKS
ncbi:alkaline phosphatase PhoX [Pedobacter foliorum]|uniref:alkaline phosphatase PhoX n=1 Tax=Pedobacter foliorum TaxID=2739058 RepID=UPI001566AF16|nr:alkaline phosphatase PhoX [Pedobacter foliorum]NRF39527.1 DUF839 domain-containing protein [Pedobacter foliorum]